jgi:hypothetical protein
VRRDERRHRWCYAIEQLLSEQRAKNKTLVSKYKGIVQQAIAAAGGRNVSRETIEKYVMEKYGMRADPEVLTAALADFKPSWSLFGMFSSKQPVHAPAVRKSPAQKPVVSPGPKKTIGKKAATPTKAATLKKAAALKKAATPTKAATPETPPLTKMCAEAILRLKDRTGSSRWAIKAYILAKYGRECDVDYTPSALTAALNTKWFLKNKGGFKLSDEGKKMIK